MGGITSGVSWHMEYRCLLRNITQYEYVHIKKIQDVNHTHNHKKTTFQLTDALMRMIQNRNAKAEWWGGKPLSHPVPDLHSNRPCSELLWMRWVVAVQAATFGDKCLKSTTQTVGMTTCRLRSKAKFQATWNNTTSKTISQTATVSFHSK